MENKKDLFITLAAITCFLDIHFCKYSLLQTRRAWPAALPMQGNTLSHVQEEEVVHLEI